MNDIMHVETRLVSSLPMLGNYQYDTHIEQFNAFLKSENRIPDEESLIKFFDFCKTVFMPSSVRVKKTAIKQSLEDAYSKFPNGIDAIRNIEDALKKIALPPVDRKVKSDRIVNEEEIGKLLNGGVWFNKKKNEEELVRPPEELRLLMVWLSKTGMRIFEVITLKKSSFYQSRKSPTILYFEFIGKRGKPRTNFIHKEIYTEVNKYFNGSIYLFDFDRRKEEYMPREWEPTRKRISHQLNSYSKKVIGSEVNPHDFRHYFVTQKLLEGKSLKAIASFVGHSSTSTTSDMYVHDELKPEDVY